MNPPVKIPERFRGKIIYEKDICIGCKLCLKICPSQVIVFKEEETKIKIYLACCTFCAQCNDIRLVHCLQISKEFLTAGTEK